MSHIPLNTDPYLGSQEHSLFHHMQASDANSNPYPDLHMMFSNHQAQNNVDVHTSTSTTTTITSSGNYFYCNNDSVASSSFPTSQQQILDQSNNVGLQMAYEDAWRVCHPDYKNPFTSLEDACERLLPYHVVADYEEEEDDKILDSGELVSRSQQWDNNISAKVAEFTATFEKQVHEFNLIANKKSRGELQTEERLMIEHMLLQDEKRAFLEAKAEMESRQRASQMTDMAHSQTYFPVHPEMFFGGGSLRSQTSNIPIFRDMNQHDQIAAMSNTGWDNIGQKDENEEGAMWRDGRDLN